MAAVVVGTDIPFFQNRIWERLAANVGIVLVFGCSTSGSSLLIKVDVLIKDAKCAIRIRQR